DVVKAIDDGNKVVSAKMYDGDQRVDLELKDEYTNSEGRNLGKNVTFYYVEPRATDVVKAIDDGNKVVSAKMYDGDQRVDLELKDEYT
ncbi:hypothetical protein BUE67_15790, partial [Corynebacterium diphtheriae]